MGGRGPLQPSPAPTPWVRRLQTRRSLWAGAMLPCRCLVWPAAHSQAGSQEAKFPSVSFPVYRSPHPPFPFPVSNLSSKNDLGQRYSRPQRRQQIASAAALDRHHSILQTPRFIRTVPRCLQPHRRRIVPRWAPPTAAARTTTTTAWR